MKSSKSMAQFFEFVLGAKLKNTRWSWGAVSPVTGRVFLRVWEGQIERRTNTERVRVQDEQWRGPPGYEERRKHLDIIQSGADAFGVVYALNDAREKFTGFDETVLLHLGKITNRDGRTYAAVVGRVPVAQAVRSTTNNALAEDLEGIARIAGIDPTTKSRLIEARVGQGKFRKDVLQLWENRCCVTSSTTVTAIRASHIKPWRDSTDAERLDPNNGLPLIANLDALFDAGLISFSSTGKLCVAPNFNKRERRVFALLDHRSLRKTPSPKIAEYLAYHRRYHGFDN